MQKWASKDNESFVHDSAERHYPVLNIFWNCAFISVMRISTRSDREQIYNNCATIHIGKLVACLMCKTRCVETDAAANVYGDTFLLQKLNMKQSWVNMHGQIGNYKKKKVHCKLKPSSSQNISVNQWNPQFAFVSPAAEIFFHSSFRRRRRSSLQRWSFTSGDPEFGKAVLDTEVQIPQQVPTESLSKAFGPQLLHWCPNMAAHYSEYMQLMLWIRWIKCRD